MIANSLLTVIPTLMAIAPCKVPTSTSGALRHADEGIRTSDRPITRCWLRPVDRGPLDHLTVPAGAVLSCSWCLPVGLRLCTFPGLATPDSNEVVVTRLQQGWMRS